MLEQYIEAMFKEDIPTGDITTDAIFTNQETKARLIAKQDGVICGLKEFTKVMHYVDETLVIVLHVSEGDQVETGMLLAEITGKTGSILKAERVGLNLLQHLSGIATKTNQFVEVLNNSSINIMETRKTLPLYRDLQKYAVTIGGGVNHRFSLSDQAMIKDNHIKAAQSLTNAVSLVRNQNPEVTIITECETLKQVEEALGTSTDIIMLDNMDNELIQQACQQIAGAKLIEVSGNITIERLKKLRTFAIDRISIGELTHSVEVLDISLKF